MSVGVVVRVLAAVCSFTLRVRAELARHLGKRVVAATWFLLLVIPGWASAADVQHVYDESGRLAGTVAPTGEAAQYQYDAVGNVTAIQRFAAGALTLLEFSPNSGSAGTDVTLLGTGFSTTPTSNIVKFNGTAATVSSATATSLVVKVPTGATTGSVSVTVGTSTVVSAIAFTVSTAVVSAPAISGFSPSVGAAGTVVTVNGSNFAAPAADNDVRFGGTPAIVTTRTATTLATSVPTNAATGKISVSTAYGTAISANDFFVPPVGYAAGDVASTARINNPGTGVVTVSTAGKLALIASSALAGTRSALFVTNSTIASGVIKVFYPDGTAMAAHNVGLGASKSAVMTFPVGGTYTLVLDPDSSNTGSLTLTIGAPDLEASGLTITGAVTASKSGAYSIPLSFNVKNVGSVVAPAYWDDNVFFSTDATLAGNDIFIGGTRRATDLAVGASYAVSLTAVTDVSAPGGAVNLIAASDSGWDAGKYMNGNGRVEEMGEANNKFASAVTLPTKADLTVTSLTAGTISGNQNGSYNIPVTYTVKNVGALPAIASWWDVGVLSLDSTLTHNGDAVIGTLQRTVNLAAGASYTVTTTYVTDTVITAGTYTVFAAIDGGFDHGQYWAGSSVGEANELNNAASVAVTLPAKADLTVTAFSVGTITVNINGSYNIPVTYTVKNSGSLPAIANWQDAGVLSVNASLDHQVDFVIGSSVRTTNLAAGATYSTSMTLTTDTATTPGAYTLFLATDAYWDAGKYWFGGTVGEVSDSNNAASKSITLPTK